MRILLGNGKFWAALFYDAVGAEDKAHKVMSLDTLDEKKDYWLNVAGVCATAGIIGAPFTYYLSLLLLLVSARKMQLYFTKKGE
jgi:hypothetical protein